MGTPMWQRSFVIFVIVLATSCEFSAAVATDATVTTTITVGFENGATTADEKSGTVAVAIVLSEASATEITVQWEIAGGGAQPVDDFTPISPATVRFAAGETRQTIELAIQQDTAEEPDESILLVLAAPIGARLATNAHEVKISANALPRIRFAMPASTADEPTDATLEVSLDEASSFPITVDFVIANTSTASNADYTLVPATVTFPPGSTAQPLALDVLQDALDEDPETVVVTLQNATNAIILDAENTRTHTIADEDPEPNVAFALAASTVTEGGTTTNITVTLTPVSGRAVTAPFTLDGGSSATATTDFAVATASPLTFAAGETTKNITVSIVQDTIDEPNETVVLALGNATNAGEVAPLTHTLTITDDDLVCYGAGTSMVCFDSPPTGAQALPSSIDTTNDPLCAATQPTGWTANQDAACVIARDTLTMSGATTVTGSRPLVLVGVTSISVTSTIDVASKQGGATGPAAPSSLCKPFSQTPSGSSSGGGGGAGGSFMAAGGDGGTGDGGNRQGGTAATVDMAAPTRLRAGCSGQRGGNGGGGLNSGAVGLGGGAIYLVSGGTITLGNNAVINASGAGGTGGDRNTGGSGAGSGGMIKLHAAAVMIMGNPKLVANGGGGASGGDNAAGGTAGNDPSPATPGTGGSGGSGGGGADGGNGFPAASRGGANGGGNNGGGGGGGGGGYIQSNLALSGVTTSAGLVSAP